MFSSIFPFIYSSKTMSKNEEEALERLKQAKTFKDQGNDFFKSGNISKARVKYSTSLAFTKGLAGREMNNGESMAQLAAQSQGRKLSKELHDELNEFDAIVNSNIAMCYLKLEKPHEALDAARRALSFNPNYWKASLRLAEAKQRIRDYDGCLKVLDKVLATEAGNDSGAVALCRKLRDIAQKGLKDEAQKRKKAFNNIFERAREVSGDTSESTTENAK